MSQFLIRSPTLVDLPALMEIERQAHDYPWSQAQLAQSLAAAENDQHHCVNLLQFEAQAVGYYVMQSVLEDAELLNLAVKPSMQGNGLGNFLLNHMLSQALDRGARQVFLEVRASNERALKLYRKAGFDELNRRKGYYRRADGREDAIVMRKSLAPDRSK